MLSLVFRTHSPQVSLSFSVPFPSASFPPICLLIKRKTWSKAKLNNTISLLEIVEKNLNAMLEPFLLKCASFGHGRRTKKVPSLKRLLLLTFVWHKSSLLESVEKNLNTMLEPFLLKCASFGHGRRTKKVPSLKRHLLLTFVWHKSTATSQTHSPS